MPVNLKKIHIECGHPHDDTGRWIDTSYTRYKVTIQGESALEKLRYGLKELEHRLGQIRDQHDRDYQVAYMNAQVHFMAQLRNYESALAVQKQLHWMRKLFSTGPIRPRLVEPDRNPVDEINRASRKLRETLSLLNSIDDEFGEYTASQNDACPFEYNIMVLREIPPAEVVVAIAQLNNR